MGGGYMVRLRGSASWNLEPGLAVRYVSCSKWRCLACTLGIVGEAFECCGTWDAALSSWQASMRGCESGGPGVQPSGTPHHVSSPLNALLHAAVPGKYIVHFLAPVGASEFV